MGFFIREGKSESKADSKGTDRSPVPKKEQQSRSSGNKRHVHNQNRELNAKISGTCSHSCNKGEVVAKSRGPSLKTALKKNRNKPQQDFSQLILSLPWQQIDLRPHCCTDLKPRLPKSQRGIDALGDLKNT